MKDCRKLTGFDWIGILTITISFFSFFYYINYNSQDRILNEIDSLRVDVRAVDAKVDTHVQYHLENKGNVNCQSTEKEVSYARKEEPETSLKTQKEIRERYAQSLEDKRR